jgi:tripartite-type tricarboxylate transporter receptor subunit TctC
MGPAGTPAPITKKLAGEIIKAMQDPDTKAKLAKLSVQPLGSTPEEYAAYMQKEVERWTKVIRNSDTKS